MSRKTSKMALLVAVILVSAAGCRQPTTPQEPSTEARLSITVLDSVNGSRLTGPYTITAIDRNGQVISLAADSNPAVIGLTKGRTYDITVTYAGRAQDRHERFYASDASMSDCYILQGLGNSSFAVESPVIESFAYTSSTDPTSSAAYWTEIEADAIMDFSAITGFKVVTTSKASVDDTSWSGSFLLGIDRSPSYFSGQPFCTSSEGFDAATEIFTTTGIFKYSGNLTKGTHKLCLVGYDRTNNRVQRVVSVNSSVALQGGDSLVADFIVGLTPELSIYGVSRSLFSMAPGGNSSERTPKALTALSTGSVSYQALLRFSVKDADSTNGNDVPIRGFRIYRSADGGSSFNLIGTKTYDSPWTGTSGVHVFYDADSTLAEGMDYSYRVTVFTDDEHSLTSSSTKALHFLPAFTVSLVSPSNKSSSIDASNLPDFSFRISTPGLFGPGLADYYYFAPVIRDKTGRMAFNAACAYDIADGDLFYLCQGPDFNWYYASIRDHLKLEPSDYIVVTPGSGLVTLKPAFFTDARLASNINYATYATLVLKTGVTYEWDLFGEYLGDASDNVASFFSEGRVEEGRSLSYADVYQSGQDSTNGWFSFTVK